VLAQDPRADRVKGGGGHAPSALLAEQVGEPQPQLARGAHAEGHSEDLPRPRAAGGEQMRDPVSEGLGLARARAGEQQQRPGAVADRLSLLGGQPGEQRVG
jgi:hypothetical protein